MNGWAVFFIIVLLLLVFGGGGYVLYTQYRARKLGLPPPSWNPFAKRRTEPSNYSAPAPAPSGIQGWIRDKIDSIRGGGRGRTAGGAYEGYGAGTSGRDSYNQRRGFGPLDPDEAWDARVGNETGGYGYDEQELGLQDPSHGPYGGGGYGDVGVGGYEEGRGRSRSRQRELDDRYDAEMHGGQQRLNPFGDTAEASSMRSVSPRPDGQQRAPSSHKRGQSSLNTTGSADNSPTERRNSAFKKAQNPNGFDDLSGWAAIVRYSSS